MHYHSVTGILLLNSLNGTKQGGYDWHERADLALKDLGFKACVTDPCLYHRWDGTELTLVGRFVDDFRITSDNPLTVVQLEKDLSKYFSVKSPPEGWWLGMKIDHDREAGILTLTQEQFIKELLDEFGMADCHPQYTPAAPGTKLLKAEVQDPLVASFDMPSLIGSLLWLARTSRPDILYATNQLCRHVRCFNTTHVIAAKRVLRYLKATINLPLILRRPKQSTTPCLEVFVDADFAGEPEQSDSPARSTSGIVAYIKDIGPIYNQSSLQTTIARSTAEAEYVAVGTASATIVGFRQLLAEIGFQQEQPTKIYNDNQACIAIANKPTCGSNLRHIKINYHYTKQMVRDNQISLEYIPTATMIADILTKALAKPRFEELRSRLMNHD